MRPARSEKRRASRALRGPRRCTDVVVDDESSRTAVVHLVWGPLGRAPFETFVDSYARHDAGMAHDLVLLFNGVADADLDAYRVRAAGLAPREIVLEEPHMDLAAYVAAARRLDHDRVCFLNSYSEILVARWLRLLADGLERSGAGAAGATGSWASPLSYNLFQLGLSRTYAGRLRDRRAAREAFWELRATQPHGPVRHWLHTAWRTPRHGRGTGRFPAVHLRTNAFLVDRKRLLSLDMEPARTKWDTYRLESGRRSITAQLRAAGSAPVVVDARGVARPPEEWHRGDVLWQADQDDLLVADNVTRLYAGATRRQREILAGFAWGAAARPCG